MTEMANQIKVGRVYHSQMLSAKRQFNVERERGKMKLQIIFDFNNALVNVEINIKINKCCRSIVHT